MKIARMDKVWFSEDYSWRIIVFRDRRHAGLVLAEAIENLGYRPSIVYGLAAGGVPVALEAAEKLGSCMDIVAVKKITYPWTTEAGFGAVAADGTLEYDMGEAERIGLTGKLLEERIREALRLARERLLRLRGSLEYPSLEGRVVALVDDGIATGYTMRVGLRFLKKLSPKMLIAAAPTASTSGALYVSELADAVIVVNLRGGPVYAVADAYQEWHDIGDEELEDYIAEAGRRRLLCTK